MTTRTTAHALAAGLLGALLAWGCGSSETEPAPSASPAIAPTAPAAPPAVAAPGPASMSEPTAAAALAPSTSTVSEPATPLAEVDLLHAAPSRVAVSSAYRDSAAQVAHLVDGDISTAWNSRSGDLVGAWIEVEVPEDATVRAIAMTPGFVRQTANSDLFTGNHRISRVRVSRIDEGVIVPLLDHALDVDSRALVEIPVGSPGMRFRIEVLETRPGSREDWREICVSELRVLGTLAGATPGASSPTISVGPLGPVRTLAEEEAEDAAAEAELDALDRQAALDGAESVLTTWERYSGSLHPFADETSSARAVAERERGVERRRAAFNSAAEFVEGVDAAQASQLRARADQGALDWSARRPDLDRILAAMETVMAPLTEHACAWANLRGVARLRDYALVIEGASFTTETILDRGYDLSNDRLRAEDRARYRAELDELRSLGRALDGMHIDDLDTLTAPARRAVLDLPEARSLWLREDWRALRADVERAEQACGH